MRHYAPRHLPLHRYPLDPWRLVEREYDVSDIGVTETLFSVANG
jgi:alpha,alpha-trehalose phosphorylase